MLSDHTKEVRIEKAHRLETSEVQISSVIEIITNNCTYELAFMDPESCMVAVNGSVGFSYPVSAMLYGDESESGQADLICAGSRLRFKPLKGGFWSSAPIREIWVVYDAHRANLIRDQVR